MIFEAATGAGAFRYRSQTIAPHTALARLVRDAQKAESMNKTALMLSSFALVTGLALAQTAKPALMKPAPAASAAVNCPAALKAKVNLNSAKLETMRCLPGFSDKIAKDVIANRPFKDGNEFKKKIEDIGPILWKKIETFVTFK